MQDAREGEDDLRALIVLLFACSSTQPKPRVDASDLFAKFECNRCHDVPGMTAAVRDKHCFACHQQIRAGTFEADPANVATWRSHIKSLTWSPSLVTADRLRRDWIRDFLLAPHDIRPALVAEMPRLSITRTEAERIAAALSPDDDGALPDGDITRGEQLYRKLACARCHRFTGASVDAHVAPSGNEIEWTLAPDLRHARERMRPSALATWIASPRGAMPSQNVAAADARDLAAFIAKTTLAAPEALAPITRLPILERPVLYAEVEEKVFHKVCWHCHAVPEYAGGDGGPGKSGGFGFAARGLDLSSYEGISSGALGDDGEPHSVFAKLDGTPRIVAHLLARHAEARGTFGPIRGMPLGMPPLSLEDIQLVDTWIAQGRPQ